MDGWMDGWMDNKALWTPWTTALTNTGWMKLYQKLYWE